MSPAAPAHQHAEPARATGAGVPGSTSDQVEAAASKIRHVVEIGAAAVLAVTHPQPPVETDHAAGVGSRNWTDVAGHQEPPPVRLRVICPELGRHPGGSASAEHHQSDAVDPRGHMPGPSCGGWPDGNQLSPGVRGHIERPQIAQEPVITATREQVRDRARGIDRPGVTLSSWRSIRGELEPGPARRAWCGYPLMGSGRSKGCRPMGS